MLAAASVLAFGHHWCCIWHAAVESEICTVAFRCFGGNTYHGTGSV